FVWKGEMKGKLILKRFTGIPVKDCNSLTPKAHLRKLTEFRRWQRSLQVIDLVKASPEVDRLSEIGLRAKQAPSARVWDQSCSSLKLSEG
ncbi:hypothetical protein LOAG_10574, partial [Loa loa]